MTKSERRRTKEAPSANHTRHCVILSSFVICHSCFVIVDCQPVAPVNFKMTFRRAPAILIVFIMCAGFLPGQTQSGSETGIEGVITIDPVRPGPVRADAASSPLANAVFVVESQKGETRSFTTDDQGRFRLPLPPGHYKVSLKGK